ncbi:hypothetical protein UA08_03714 [Talaromyces atroroseus]|uniref:Thiol-specific monooxygenase n=1 Tax=Talaromyces atroroseus TaxID=1441469 RepID=A0A225B284_TALAT|nr:hypothetical protein UA08_03714 [Talaromyces atroroseus]OKL60935.1 hypothetical protein UA08_03714 [Talaromyces atroroseus]
MRVAVIGAGPGGLAAAKYLHAENAFSAISIFEQRDEAGGVWCYTAHNAVDESFAIPHTTPQTTPDTPVSTKKEASSENVVFQSPVYDLLETNIPHTLMNYSDWKFPTGTSLFPSHQTVKEYLQDYAKTLLPSISFHTQVVDVKPLDESNKDSGWVLSALDLRTKEVSTHEFDYVVVANGHYSDPYVPDIAGIREWSQAYPDSVSHSKYYRRAEQYANKKVIVVGNSASGIDVSVQIATVAQRPLLVSERTGSPPYLNDNPNIRIVPEIAEFLIVDRAVRFIDGHVEKNVDHVLLCTGYLYSFPFLPSLLPPAVTPDGNRPSNLFQHIFYYPRPTLTFIGLPQKIIPFPLSEAQAAVIARVYSGRLQLPSLSEMKEWETNWIAKHGPGKSFNVLGYPLDAEYLNSLHDWSLRATKRDGLSNNGRGKNPPYWNEKDQWLRKLTPMIKAASQALGSKRREITVLEELGFVYDENENESDAKSKI